MATKEVLQEGTVAKPDAKTNTGLRAWLLGSGGAKKAADAVSPNTRKSRMDAAEDEAVNGKKYAAGGAVSDRDGKRFTGTVSDKSGDYESYRDSKNKEHLIAPATGKAKGSAGAGRGFENRYAAGGMVRRGFGKARGA